MRECQQSDSLADGYSARRASTRASSAATSTPTTLCTSRQGSTCSRTRTAPTAAGETAILLHSRLHLVGVSMRIKKGVIKMTVSPAARRRLRPRAAIQRAAGRGRPRGDASQLLRPALITSAGVSVEMQTGTPRVIAAAPAADEAPRHGNCSAGDACRFDGAAERAAPGALLPTAFRPARFTRARKKRRLHRSAGPHQPRSQAHQPCWSKIAS